MTKKLFRQILSSLFVLSSVVLAARAHAQTPTPTPEENRRTFGTYHETNLDFEVKVQGGVIRIYRIWRGDKSEWTINPQHADLSLSEDTQGSAYGQLLAKEISRGPRSFSQQGSIVGFFRSSPGSSPGGPGGGTPEPLPHVARFLGVTPGVLFCTNEGEAPREALATNAQGYKWVNRVGRDWAQFNFQGKLIEWGMGNFRVGTVLRDAQGRERGYADTNGVEAVTIIRDGSDRIQFIRDSENRQVEYRYNSAGLIEEVIDPDGVSTRYLYTNGQITSKTIGNAQGVPSGEETDEETTVNFSYSPRGEILSVRNLDGTGADYEYHYDAQKKLYTKTERASGNRTTRRVWDQFENLVSVEQNGEFALRLDRVCEDSAIIDRHNRVTYIDRDALGFIKDVYFPDGRRMHFEHSQKNWPELGQPWNVPSLPWGIVQVTFPSGTTVDYTRDQNGNIITAVETSATGTRHWRFAYDAFGNMTEQRLQAGATPNNALDRIDRWQYDGRGNIEWYEDGMQRRWLYEYNSRGDLKKITNPLGKVWNFTYNGKGQLRRVLDPIGYEQLFEYTNRGLLKLIRDRYDTGLESVTRYRYNHRGLVRRIVDPFGHHWNFEYNDSGEVETEIDPEGKRTRYQYDTKGRLTSVLDDNAVEIRYDYFDTAGPGQAPQIDLQFDPLVRITYPTFVEELQYDSSDRLTSRRLRPNQGSEELTVYRWNADNRLREIVRPDGQLITFTWDQLGRPLTRTEPGVGTTQYEYPNGEQIIRYRDPVGGTIEQHFNQAGDLVTEIRADQTQVSFEYDPNGNVSYYNNARGNRIRFIYNDAEELVEQRIFQTASSSTPIKTITYPRNLRGDLLGYNDGSTSQVNTVDKVGRVLTSARNFGPFVANHSFTYSPAGNRETYTSVDGIQHTYLWDLANQFKGVVIPNEGSITLGYNAQNWFQPISITSPGGTQQSFEYDDLRRVKRIRTTDPAQAVLLDYNYQYQSGPVTGAVIDTITTEHGLYDFGYDAAFRLTSSVSPQGTESFTYDGLGRRQPGSGAAWTYNANGAPLSTGAATYTYDADGNRSTKVEGGVTTQYFYDESDRLIRVESPVGNIVARYEYDPYGARLWKEVGGVRTYFDYTEEGLSSEFDANGTVTKTYLFAPGSEWSTAPLAMKQGSSYHYYQNDHLGTPRKLTNNVGAETWGATYQAYGAANVAAAGATNNLRFPGQYGDPETGLYHNFQRNYDPGLGGYLEQDPFGVAFTGANRHWYAAGNPGIYSDPTGEIIPAVIVWGAVLWLGGEAISGFPTLHCAQYLWDRCLYAGQGESCGEVLVSAATSFGIGAILKGGALVAKAAWKLRVAAPLDSIMRKVGALDFSTPPGSAVFYSGPGQGARAAAFAERTGRMTIEMTPGGRALLADPLFQSLSPAQQYHVWQRASSPFAEGASGKVNAFVRGARQDGTFRTIEEPILRSNPNVYHYIYHY